MSKTFNIDQEASAAADFLLEKLADRIFNISFRCDPRLVHDAKVSFHINNANFYGEATETITDVLRKVIAAQRRAAFSTALKHDGLEELLKALPEPITGILHFLITYEGVDLRILRQEVTCLANDLTEFYESQGSGGSEIFSIHQLDGWAWLEANYEAFTKVLYVESTREPEEAGFCVVWHKDRILKFIYALQDLIEDKSFWKPWSKPIILSDYLIARFS